ncbi:MAG: phage tail protein [Dehalococcoidia bacterium]
MNGWLVDQLPRALSQDRFTQRFISIFEEIADGIRSQVDALEYYVDVDDAPPEYVRWLGSWLNVTVDASQSLERQRAIVREAGRMYAQRGTVEGLRGLLEAITGGSVRVVDGGGTWRAGEAPPNPGRVLVRLTTTGGVPEGQIYHLVAAEAPIGISFDIRIDDRTIEPPRMAQGLSDIPLEEPR